MDNTEACYRLGCMLLDGRGCKSNKDKATKWLKKAAEKGHNKAQLQLDEMQQTP